MPRAHTSPAHLRPSCCAHPHSTARCPRWRQTISSRVRPRSASPDPPSHTGHIYLRIASPMGSLLRPPRVPHSVTTSYDFSRLFHTLVARPARPPWRPSSAAGHHATRPPIGYRPGTYGPPGGGRDAHRSPAAHRAPSPRCSIRRPSSRSPIAHATMLFFVCIFASLCTPCYRVRICRRADTDPGFVFAFVLFPCLCVQRSTWIPGSGARASSPCVGGV